MNIPPGPEALTAEWLTLALRQGGVIYHAAVVSFEAGALAEGQGFYGQLARVNLDYDRYEEGAPRSLIAKFSSANPQMRQQATGSYGREVNFYQHLASQTALPTPACYYDDIEPESGAHILLLQDLAPARSGSRVDGCSLEQARLAVQQIAIFHATWWESPRLSELHWLDDTRSNLDSMAQKEQYDQWWPLFFAQAKDHLPDQIRAIGERIGSHRGRIRRHIFGEALRTHDAVPRILRAAQHTLIHRDYQLDNLIFGTPEGGSPFAVVDWQFLSRGRGVWDVAYFLSESLQIADRRAWERGIWEEYYQILLDHNIRHYSLEQCRRDYRIALLQRFTALVSTIAAMPFSEEQRHIHLDILLPRNIAAILDHNAGELLV
jgi:hypothetical protein